MDIQMLERLLKREEQPKLDFKATLNLKTDGSKKELAKDVIAMANSKGGRGYIVFGVEDKTKKILGIDRQLFHEESIQQVINNRSNPPIPVSVDFITYASKELAILTVYKSKVRPHQMIRNGAFYIRRGSTTDVAHRQEIARMFQDNGIITYEKVVIQKASVEALDMKMITRRYPYDFLLLENLDFIVEEKDTYHPTIGGLLLYGVEPSRYLPHVYIEFIYDDEIDIINGNIINMLDQAEELLKNRCKKKDYPLQALLDVIANAVIHRDYLDYNRGITVEITNQHIYVSNPGALVAGNRLYDKHRIYNPRRRNPWLYQRILMADEKNRFSKSGLGLKRINEAFKSYGLVKYINLDSDNLFKVILPSFL